MNKSARPSEFKKVVKISEFKAKCLALTDAVARTGQSVVITKRGQPVAELIPCRTDSKPELFGVWKDKIKIVGDIMSPIDVEWDAMK
jgi:prevent-host-death family protein